MRILLLNPPSLRGEIYMKEIGRCGRKSVAGEIWPQTGLAYLAAVLEQDKHEVMIIDSMAETFSMEEFIQKIKGFNPKLIVVNTTTPTFTNDSEIVKIIRKNIKCYIGFVGTHVSVLPKESLANSKADFLLAGEAEYSLKELANKINSSWKSIKGLCFRKKGKIYMNKPRQPITNLDELPFPARHLLPNEKYVMPLTNGKPFATIISSRGCPFRCIFCRAGDVWGKNVRTRSVKSVMNEIKEIVNKFGIHYIAFMTDTFTVNKKWTLNLCNEIIKNKINIKWFCNSRVDTIDEEMLAKMKEACCVSISYGI
jgi:magnesium-protoporphyrin IX monomethyl ester (oxidative) cyclase